MSKNPLPLKIRTWLVLSIVIGIAVPHVWAGQGWYLLYPPSTDGKEPLGTWHQSGAYGSAESCERDRLRRIDSIKTAAAKDRLNAKKAKTEADVRQWKEIMELYEDQYKQWVRARCIASDDPRLK